MPHFTPSNATSGLVDGGAPPSPQQFTYRVFVGAAGDLIFIAGSPNKI